MKANSPMDPLSFFKKAKKADVDRGFLASLRKDIVRHMAEHPARPVDSTTAAQAVPARAFWRFAAVPASIALIVAIAGGSTVFAAQGSLPGDPLYTVKLLSEQVELAATVTPLARSETQLSFAAKRVDEASKLVEKNGESGVSHEAMQTVINNFNSQIAGAFAEARDLQEKNDASGSLLIARDIKIATEAYEVALMDGKTKGGDVATQDINQFIGMNAGFNDRASAALSNASGTGEPVTTHEKNQDDGSGDHSGESSGDAKNSQGSDKNNSSILPTGNVPASTNESDGHDGNHDGGDSSEGGPTTNTVPAAVLQAPTPAPSTGITVATSSALRIAFPSSSSGSAVDGSGSSTSGEQGHVDTSHGGKPTENLKNTGNSGDTDGKNAGGKNTN